MEQRTTSMQEWILVAALTLLAVVGIVTLYELGLPFGKHASNAKSVSVVVSMPLQLNTGKFIADGITLAFEERGYQAGGTEVTLLLKDGGIEDGTWSAEKEAAIASSAASTASVVAYIGTFNSGAAKISMPILNQAGIVQVSPGNTWPGLTKPGFLPGEPGIFYPTGVRHYFRVSTTDDLQGPAGALWARDLGFKSVFIVDDSDVYGEGIADLFKDQAERLGISILGHEHLQSTAPDFDTTLDLLVAEIVALDPDFIYYGGTVPTGGPDLLLKLRAASSTVEFMGPDGILGQDLIDFVGSEYAEGVYATTIGAPSSQIATTRAQDFRTAFLKRFEREPDVFAALGYEAAEVVLDAITRASEKTRAEVLREVRATRGTEGLFGSRAFDQNGDTTIKLLSGHRAKDGEFVFVSKLLVP